MVYHFTVEMKENECGSVLLGANNLEQTMIAHLELITQGARERDMLFDMAGEA